MNKPSKANILDQYFALSFLLQTIIWFVLFLVIKHDTLLAPPIWDAASGIFPAAIFLSESNFDVLSLIQLEDWWLGGPNVNAFSLWTWLVALVMYITNSPTTTFLVLHVLSFVLTAFAFSTLLRCIDHYGVDRSLTCITGALVLSTPLILVQAGFIYTEIPVMCFGIFAYAAWQKDREGLAVIFALIALSIKLTGVVIAFSIGLVLCFRFIVNPISRRIWQALSILTFFWILMSIYSWLGGVEQTHGMSWGKDKNMFESLYGRVSSIPEIAILLCVGLVSSLISLFLPMRVLSKNSIEEPSNIYEPLGGTRMILFAFLAVFCASIAYGTNQGFLFLPRYILPMIPFGIIATLIVVKALKLETGFSVLFLILCYLNIYNHNGALYAPALSFGITERTHLYQDYSQGHSALIEGISKLPEDYPIYVSRGIGYLVSHPMMGRLEKTKPNIHKIYRPEYISKQISDFPNEFYLVISTHSRVHGGRRIRELLSAMKQAPDREVEELQSGVFAGMGMGIYHVRSRGR